MKTSAIDISRLSSTIAEELKNYKEEVVLAAKEAIETTAKKTEAKLKETSPVKTGRYKKGWRTKKVFENQDGERVIVFNATSYQLTHLLEYGHVKFINGVPTGGRVEAKPHIRKAEQEAEKELGNEIKVKLR